MAHLRLATLFPLTAAAAGGLLGHLVAVAVAFWELTPLHHLVQAATRPLLCTVEALASEATTLQALYPLSMAVAEVVALIERQYSLAMAA